MVRFENDALKKYYGSHFKPYLRLDALNTHHFPHGKTAQMQRMHSMVRFENDALKRYYGSHFKPYLRLDALNTHHFPHGKTAQMQRKVLS